MQKIKNPLFHDFFNHQFFKIVAGLDLENPKKGSWLGINKSGVFCTLLNRSGTAGAKDDKESRGNLVIKALTFSSAEDSVAYFMDKVNPSNYQGFYLVIADSRNAQIITSDGIGFHKKDIPSGFHMVTSRGLDNINCSRTKMHLEDWKSAKLPNPDSGDWKEWVKILSRECEEGNRNGMSLEKVTWNLFFLAFL